MNNFLLDFLAFGAIISGILVITSRNPVISVLFLISVFVNVAGYLVLLGVGFIGISYIVVYVGAVTVLFLFVIIMLNIELSEIHSMNREFTQNVPLGIIIASIFTYELSSVLSVHTAMNITNTLLGFFLSSQKLFSYNLSEEGNIFTIDTSQVFCTFNTINPDILFSTSQGANLQVQSIGSMIYTNASIWLIILSVILLLAIVAPITLSINRK